MLVKRLKDLNAPLQEILGVKTKVRHNFPYSLSHPHSLTRMTTRIVGGSVVPSLLFYFERDGDGTRARTTNDPRFSRSVTSSSSHSLSLVTSWDDDHHRHHHHLGEQLHHTALSLAACDGYPKCVELLLPHMTKEDIWKKTWVRPLSLAPFVLIPRSSLVRLHLRPPVATHNQSHLTSR